MKSYKELQYIQYTKARLFWLHWPWGAQRPTYLVSPFLSAMAVEVLSQKQVSLERCFQILWAHRALTLTLSIRPRGRLCGLCVSPETDQERARKCSSDAEKLTFRTSRRREILFSSNFVQLLDGMSSGFVCDHK